LRHVAIIGADFVPSSLPPATRIRFFAQHLPDFGWEPIILTTKPEYYDWSIDTENECLLPESLEVIRTEALASSWTHKVGVGDIGMRSLWHHWRALKQLCQQRRIDLVLIPVPPYVPMILGRMAHERFGIPYVIDYIDPWVSEYYWSVPRDQRPPKWPLAYAMARLLEPYAVKKVGHITGVSKGTTDSVVSRYRQLKEDDATEIPYGAEVGDFHYLRHHPRKNGIFDPADGALHISSVGACIPAMYPAARALFQAVRLGVTRNPALFSRLKLHFVGTSYAPNSETSHTLEAMAREADLEDQVSERVQRVSYLDSLQVMVDSHALILLGSNEPHYTASKVFTYILAGRPLLAVFHEASNVVTTLRRLGCGSVVTFGQHRSPADGVGEICKSLEEILTSPRSAQSAKGTPEVVSTKGMTGRLAQALDKALLQQGTQQT
jgi:glycosyl transferase family 4